MSFRSPTRIVRTIAAVGVLLALAVPLSAGAATSAPDIDAKVSIPLTGVDDAASNANCKSGAKTLINAATPATLTFDYGWQDSGYSSGNKYDYSAKTGSLSGLFDAPVTFTGTEMGFAFTWDPTSGAVSRTSFSSQTISADPGQPPRAKIGGEGVTFIISSGNGTGTLKKNDKGEFEGTLTFADFELSVDFIDFSLGYDCRLTAKSFQIVLGTPAPATPPAIDLQLKFEAGDSIRSGNLPVTTSGGGLAANAPYTVVLRSDPVQIGAGNAGGDGQFTNTSPLPADTPAGSHSVTVSSFAPDGSAVQGVGYFTIDDRGIVTSISYEGPTPEAATPRFTG